MRPSASGAVVAVTGAVARKGREVVTALVIVDATVDVKGATADGTTGVPVVDSAASGCAKVALVVARIG